MPGGRHPHRSSQVPPPAAPEQSGSGEVQELREQVAAMMGAMQRQEARFERLQALMEQQVAVEGEGIGAVPLTACPLPRSVPPAASGSATPDTTAKKCKTLTLLNLPTSG